jgi:hypothetical protein
MERIYSFSLKSTSEALLICQKSLMAQATAGPQQFDAILESEHPWSSKDIGSNSISVSFNSVIRNKRY